MGTAVITGGSSGIGKSYARKLASLGYDLIITGRRAEALEELSMRLKRRYLVSVEPVAADLSKDKDLNMLIGLVSRKEDIAFLVNNAGFGSGKTFQEGNESEHMQMLKVHVEAAVKLTYAVLPQMARRKRGGIINVSSIGAFAPSAGSVMYSGTKLFLKSFTESLHLEVHPHGIQVQCLCPGLTHTRFHERRSNGKAVNTNGWLTWMEPGEVVERSLHALGKGRIVYIPGMTNRLVVGLLELIPSRIYYFLMSRIQGLNVSRGGREVKEQYHPDRVITL